MTAASTPPPPAITAIAANCADPAKTTVDIRTAIQAGSPATVASTPKEAPNTRTATAIGVAETRMRRTDPTAADYQKTGAGGVRRQLYEGFLACAECRDPLQDLQGLPEEGRNVPITSIVRSLDSQPSQGSERVFPPSS